MRKLLTEGETAEGIIAHHQKVNLKNCSSTVAQADEGPGPYTEGTQNHTTIDSI